MFYRGDGFYFSDNEKELLQVVLLGNRHRPCVEDWSAEVLRAQITCMTVRLEAKQDRSGRAYQALLKPDRQQMIHTLLLLGRPRMRHMFDHYRTYASEHIARRPVTKLLHCLSERCLFVPYDESPNTPFYQLTAWGEVEREKIIQSGIYEWHEKRIIKKYTV